MSFAAAGWMNFPLLALDAPPSDERWGRVIELVREIQSKEVDGVGQSFDDDTDLRPGCLTEIRADGRIYALRLPHRW